MVAFPAQLTKRNVTHEVIHTSGHAGVVDPQRLAAALGPDVLVPVHKFHADQFVKLFGAYVKRRRDGEWWDV